MENSGGAPLMTEAMGAVVEKVIPWEVTPVTGGYIMAEGMVVIGAALVYMASERAAP